MENHQQRLKKVERAQRIILIELLEQIIKRPLEKSDLKRITAEPRTAKENSVAIFFDGEEIGEMFLRLHQSIGEVVVFEYNERSPHFNPNHKAPQSPIG